MNHPNSDFLKKFFSKPMVDQRHLPGKHDLSKRLEEYKNRQKKLEESFDARQKEIIDFSSRIPAKPKTYITEDEQESWIPHITSVGVFYYNKKHGKWMNNFGVVSDTLEGLIGFEALGMIDSYGDKKPRAEQVIQSFFSDSGSSLALFDSYQNTIDVYSVSYSPAVTTTYQNTVNLGNIGFNAQNNQKCLISEDGSFLIVSCPENKSVYFFDVDSNTLLQTITEDQPGFGSLLAADKEFCGIAVSSTELNRPASTYDVRYTAYSACTPIHYYKRNFKSQNKQRFKKIASNHAYLRMRATGLDGETIRTFVETDKIVQSGYLIIQEDSSQNVSTGIYRYSDISAKGYNFASAAVALKEDQINYKATFLNIDSPKYIDILTNPNFNPPALSTVDFKAGRQYNITQSNINRDEYTSALPTDNQSASVFAMLTLPAIKQFSISRKLSDGNYYDDQSYRLYSANVPVLFNQNIGFGGTEIIGSTGYAKQYFNNNILGKFAEKTFIRGPLSLRLMYEDATVPLLSVNNIHPVIEERVINTKIGINDVHTYSVSQIITKNSIKNIRIYRTYNTSEDGKTSFHYQDYIKSTTLGDGIPSPPIDNVGMVKIMYASSDATELENSFFDIDTASSTIKNRLGASASKPFLSDPANCPNSEFAYQITQNILNQTLVSVFVSNTHLFLNFDDNSLVFYIDSSVSYKPLKYKTTLNTLKNYNFSYNSFGNYFLYKNILYKYNSTTNILDQISTIGD